MKKILKFTAIILSLSICLASVTSATFKVKAATPTTLLYDGGMYRIRNVATGLYLTAYSGADANGTNVVQQPLNTSNNAQIWVVSWGVLQGYYLYPMCSGNGHGRVLDINRGSSSLASGQNVQLWTSTDAIAQSWDFYYGSTSLSASIRPRHNSNIALCAYGNGSGSTGTSPTSDGNVFVKTYDATDTYQQWFVEYIDQAPTTPYVTISAMTTKFPAGRFWNHGSLPNNVNNTTDTACPVHGNCSYDGSCGCNSFETTIQCAGFVKKLSNDIYHDSYLSGNWLKTTDQSYFEHIRRGDIIKIGIHLMMVEDVDHENNYITVLECNNGANCIIDRTRDVSMNMAFVFIARSPFLWY